MVNSRAKGAAGERELSKFLREHGYSARRSQQYCGAAGDEDITHTVPDIYIECKRVQNLNLDKALEQAVKDSEGTGKVPTIWHRKNGKEWKVTLYATDFLKLVEKLSDV